LNTILERPLPFRPRSSAGAAADGAAIPLADARYQAFALMRIGYTVLPLAMGIDKFFNAMVSWPTYLAGWIDDIAPGTAQQFMYFVGAVEIVAGLLVLIKPRYAAYVVAAWLAGIVVDLFSAGRYDIGVRDFGLLVGALTLGRLAAHYDPPLGGRARP
jgi:uncharacterized membrane protein YphA (DoxX/SURF4 family)